MHNTQNILYILYSLYNKCVNYFNFNFNKTTKLGKLKLLIKVNNKVIRYYLLTFYFFQLAELKQLM